MSLIYRKSLKGIDEVAFKSTGLPLRLASYLLAVDGQGRVWSWKELGGAL